MGKSKRELKRKRVKGPSKKKKNDDGRQIAGLFADGYGIQTPVLLLHVCTVPKF